VIPFGQFLFGGSRLTAGSGSGSSNQFAYRVGGVDIGLLPHLMFRSQLSTTSASGNCGTLLALVLFSSKLIQVRSQTVTYLLKTRIGYPGEATSLKLANIP
jgi:hypothetical protein